MRGLNIGGIRDVRRRMENVLHNTSIASLFVPREGEREKASRPRSTNSETGYAEDHSGAISSHGVPLPPAAKRWPRVMRVIVKLFVLLDLDWLARGARSRGWLAAACRIANVTHVGTIQNRFPSNTAFLWLPIEGTYRFSPSRKPLQ